MPGMAKEPDWRLQGQEKYLQGATLKRKRYRAQSPESEHEHCEFCWAKFMDPSFSPSHAAAVDADPKILTEGYAVQGGKTIHGVKDDYWWVCPTCTRDFAAQFEWFVIQEPPEG